ncbi:hypothetical protein AA101099_1754 [Neoasaia chiangmaiensis NBRC 101099]|uniref:Uncharacterized protein n=1 Tax=Neoasaia chiangmaiensis TaxID=320497 RepID=A0A1U9KR03_9PROT|nr:hypothetical protein [Neoasaia chiangmaiensis]AQS88291.1 hypothetical protein A0U93_10425 [Neoasaia chiangmaiensis]GBR39635.1 hypothetical protein AA101099_1754 [Neoasaia chiangmaiensis NBRC 101099]GEN14675.1 hypothetical protein NCH01_11060 [Neoasaia chiangmaiensis]
MKFARRFLAAFAALALTVSVSACSTSGSTTTFSTAELNNDATAIAYAVQAIENIPGIESHLTAAQKTQFVGLVEQIKSVTAQIAANSNGSVSFDTGKDWAKHLGDDLQTLLSIATPIVQAYDPTAAGYMSTVSQMIPLVEALAGVASVEAKALPDNAAQVRARIYQGV